MLNKCVWQKHFDIFLNCASLENEKKLIELTSKKNRDKVIKNFKALDGTFGDSFNIGVWKIKKKILNPD